MSRRIVCYILVGMVLCVLLGTTSWWTTQRQFPQFLPQPPPPARIEKMMILRNNNNNNNNNVSAAATTAATTAQQQQPQQQRQDPKPILLLHVGPTKTATTTIQLGLVHHVKTQQALRQDGIHVPVLQWHYKVVSQWRKECLNKNDNTTRACQEWHTRFQNEFATPLVNDTTTTTSSSTITPLTVLKSCETFSSLPNNTLTQTWLQQLSDTWQVRILMVHRRFSSWLPSRYYQYRKYRMFGAPNQGGSQHMWSKFSPKGGAWDKRSLGEYLEHVLLTQDFAGDVAFTYQWYSDLFGKANVRVISMHDNEDNDVQAQQSIHRDTTNGNDQEHDDSSGDANNILERFMCHAVASPTACQLTKDRLAKEKIKDQNTNQIFLFDLDLLVVHAYHDYSLLGGGGTKQQTQQQQQDRFVARHPATLILRDHLQALNMTVQDDLPRLCLTPAQEEMVWERTWQTEQMLWSALQSNIDASKSGPNQTATRQQFQLDRERFCHVDALATLQNETLRTLLFRPCLYWKDNPCAVTARQEEVLANQTR